MKQLPHYLVGTIGMLVSAGAVAIGTLVIADGRLASGIITLLCAVTCAVTAIYNFIVAARMRVLNSLAKRAEEQSTKVRAAYAQVALDARKAGGSVKAKDILAAVDKWSLVYQSEKVGGASEERAIAAAFAATIAHARKETTQ